MLFRSSQRTAGLIALATLAACAGEQATTPMTPVDDTTPRSVLAAMNGLASASSQATDESSERVELKTRGQLEAFRNAASRSGGGTGIFYHGGPVLQSGTKVAAVYWASAPIYNSAPAAGTHGAGSSDASLIGTFLRGLGGSPYFNINHSYTNGSGQAIVNSLSYTQYWANNTSVPSNGASVSDAQMVAMLQAGFNNGSITYDASTVYAIFTAGTVNLGGGFGTQYCAYHTHGTVTVNGASKTVLYAAMPYDYAYASACTSSLAAANGSLDKGADYEVNTLGHEIEETTTDMMGTAWYDNRGYENADKCAWTWGATYTTAAGGKANMNLGGRDFLVQQNWVNSGTGGCKLSF